MDIADAIKLLAWYAKLDNHDSPEVALYARAQIKALRSTVSQNDEAESC